MHFFGTMGTLSFVFGILVTIGLIADKIYKLHYQLYAREVTDQPLFYLALVAVIVGVQLFMAGFVAEMITMNTGKKNDYIISEKISYPRNKVF